jgi:hypothetical protein
MDATNLHCSPAMHCARPSAVIERRHLCGSKTFRKKSDTGWSGKDSKRRIAKPARINSFPGGPLCWIRKCVGRNIVIRDPRNALRKGTIRFDEFLDGGPCLFEWNE